MKFIQKDDLAYNLQELAKVTGRESVDMLDRIMSGITTVLTVIILVLCFPIYGFRKDK